MFVKRELWVEQLSESVFPSWPCPEVCGGFLRRDDASAATAETLASVNARDDDDWEPSWITELYTCQLRCVRCNQAVSLAGYTSNRTNEWFDSSTQEYHYDIKTFVRPHWFLPALPLIEIPATVPVEVARPLEESFALFWTSPSSCAARVRASLEALMDAQNVRRKRKTQKGRFESLSLHKRLQEFTTKHPEIGDLLMAAKWLGNEGAHASVLTREDVLDGLDFISEALDHLYDERRVLIKQKARRVNKRRGR
jgi:hypothetical protein